MSECRNEWSKTAALRSPSSASQSIREGGQARAALQPPNDLTQRFPLIVEALARRSRSCILDGEAVACGEDGIALFERIRYQRHDGSVFLYAFDLIELNGDDLRREPLERRER
jgi:bifunctional non-homologous end joining protein LigD